MTALIWDKTDERTYEQGVDRGVVYDEHHTNGVAWNGLLSVDESRPDIEIESLYYDAIKQLDTVVPSDFSLTVTAITIPLDFLPCLGDRPVIPGFYLTKQSRRPFGLVYRTRVNTSDYKLHLVYNATVIPSSLTYSTMSESVEPTEYQWEISTRPEFTSDYRPTAHIVVDSRRVTKASLAALEDILYGFNNIMVIDGGAYPAASYREPFEGGAVPDNPYATPIDGGDPFSNPYATPTLISPLEVQAILEEL